MFLDVLHVYLRFLRASDVTLLRSALQKLEEALPANLADELRDSEAKFSEDEDDENEWEVGTPCVDSFGRHALLHGSFVFSAFASL